MIKILHEKTYRMKKRKKIKFTNLQFIFEISITC